MKKKSKIIFKNTLFKVFWILLFLSTSIVYSQVNINQIRKKVTQLNKQGKHIESQQLVYESLNKKANTPKQKVLLHILLSNIYKYIFDYETTIVYLNKASKILKNNNLKNNDSLIANINTHLAFTYFDTKKYKKAREIAKDVTKNGYLINNSLKAKLFIVEAYLFYLDKAFLKAEKKYDESITLLNKIAPHHLPLAYVKKMELYNTMGKISERNRNYELAMENAELYHYLKYKRYTVDEFLKIHKKRKDTKNSFKYQIIFDSISEIYNSRQKNIKLHLEKEKIYDLEKQAERKDKIIRTWMFIALSTFLILLSTILYYFLQKHKREKKAFEIEVKMMQKHLELLFKEKKGTSKKVNTSSLSKRQKEVLKLILKKVSYKDISEKLYISENTVKYHIKNIYNHFNVNNRKELIHIFEDS